MKKIIISMFFVLFLFGNSYSDIGTLRDETKASSKEFNELKVSTKTVRSFTKTVGFTADCDYICDGTDDQTEINLAITEAPIGGTVMLREGHFKPTDILSLDKSSITISGQGDSTYLDCSISSLYQSVGSTDMVISNLKFLGNITLLNSKNISFENCTLTPNSTWAISNIENMSFLNNTFVRSADTSDQITITGSKCFFINNKLFEKSAANYAYIDGSGNKFSFTDNYFESLGITCINDYEDNFINNVFMGVNVTDSDPGWAKAAIRFNNAIPLSSTTVRIKGNHIENYYMGIADEASGEYFENIVIDGNSFRNCLTGITLLSYDRNWEIINNNFKDCGTEITDNGTDTKIRNNIGKTGTWLPDEISVSKTDIANIQASTPIYNAKMNDHLISPTTGIAPGTLPAGVIASMLSCPTTSFIYVFYVTSITPNGIGGIISISTSTDVSALQLRGDNTILIGMYGGMGTAKITIDPKTGVIISSGIFKTVSGMTIGGEVGTTTLDLLTSNSSQSGSWVQNGNDWHFRNKASNGSFFFERNASAGSDTCGFQINGDGTMYFRPVGGVNASSMTANTWTFPQDFNVIVGSVTQTYNAFPDNTKRTTAMLHSGFSVERATNTDVGMPLISDTVKAYTLTQFTARISTSNTLGLSPFITCNISTADVNGFNQGIISYGNYTVNAGIVFSTTSFKTTAIATNQILIFNVLMPSNFETRGDWLHIDTAYKEQ